MTFLGRQLLEEDVAVQRDEKAAHVPLQIPGAPRAVRRDLAGEGPQALHRLVGAFALAAGVGIVDEAALPKRLQMPHQQVVHHAVANVGGEELPLLGLGQGRRGAAVVSPRAIWTFLDQLPASRPARPIFPGPPVSTEQGL